MKENVIGLVKKYDYGIEIPDLYSGKFDNLLHRGLLAVTICNDGSGRSERVAKELCRLGRATVRLTGGIKKFPTDRYELMTIGYELQRAPYVAIILTCEEFGHYSDILFKHLPFANRYNCSDNAITSLHVLTNQPRSLVK